MTISKCAAFYSKRERKRTALRVRMVATSFNQPISQRQGSSVTSMSYMFRGATAFKQEVLEEWKNYGVLEEDSVPVPSGSSWLFGILWGMRFLLHFS